MLTVSCVLRSGGIYDAEWVKKLRDGVARNLKVDHRFVCYSDTDVPCERIPLRHNWPGWWAKIELFDGRVSGPHIYFDLDNVAMGDLSPLIDCQHEFSMLRNFHRPQHASSCLMWFKESAPAGVWDKFISDPKRWMEYYATDRSGAYWGDQAFIWDALDRKVPLMDFPRTVVAHYKQDVAAKHCPPPSASMVIFSGSVKPSIVQDVWLKKAWV
jgi:hypothetical protein